MKRLWNILQQDLLLTYRSGHVWITLALLVGVLLLITFLPRSLEMHLEIILDNSPERLVEQALRSQGLPGDMFYADREAFNAALEKNPMKIGVVFSGAPDDPHFEIITYTQIAPENIRLLQASLDGVIADLRGLPTGEERGEITVSYLHPPTGEIPFNVKFLPTILIFEVVLLGFLIVAVMVFQEKAEGTIRAYRVTPGGTLAYILSKVVLFAVTGLVYGLIPVLYGVGLGINYLALVLLLVLASVLMTLLSLAVAVFYRNLTEWFFVGVAVLLVNSLPMISYAYPAFAPGWMVLLPSYPAVFAAREVLFAGAGVSRIAPALLYLLALSAAAFAACYFAVRTQLMRGRRV